jgi:hypothetical protein
MLASSHLSYPSGPIGASRVFTHIKSRIMRCRSSTGKCVMDRRCERARGVLICRSLHRRHICGVVTGSGARW